MFWGLKVQSNKRYSQKLQKAFHLTQAALDVKPDSGENVQVWLESENENYLLCTLSKSVKQVALNLIFTEGDEIAFSCVGGTVHLTGYVPEDFDEFGGAESSGDEDVAETLPKPSKKSKKSAAVADDSDEDDEEDEDDDMEESFAENGNGIASSEDDDDEDDIEEDEDEDEDSEDSDEETVEAPPAKVAKLDKKSNKQNGTEVSKPLTKREKKELKKLELQKKSPEQQQQKKGDASQKKVDLTQQQQQKSPKEKTLTGGVKIEDIRVGKGAEAKPGKKVQVYYEGRLKTNNKVFDSTKSGEGFKFLLGRGEVIKGWDIGVAGMKVGSKRRITCPPNMAYGAKGSPPVIPANSTLVFEVELRGVN